MNTTEERQVYLVGRILKRDLQRIQNLIDQQKLKVPEIVIDFLNILLQKGGVRNYSNQEILDVYWSQHNSDYEKIVQILCQT